MTPERRRQAFEVFDAALQREENERTSFVAEVCAHDEDLYRAVQSLLLAHQGASGFASAPIMSANSALVVGDVFGPYRIDALLGRGGMGEVYRARDTKLNRPVAIKFLTETFADAQARRRFQREAETTSSLNHPHILTVHDIGEFDDRQYLVTEFVDGGTLREWADADRRPWPQIVELLLGVADGLAAAHSAGVVHRDIKPENVLVAKNGYAKLADFGLAKLFEGRGIPETGTPTLTASATTPGTIIGTVAYMSPEQASGRPVDARSDIFSFGVVLYELLAGRRPFTGATSLEVLLRLQHEAPPPLSEQTPAPLRAVVEKALEKNPAARYQSMREVVVDLRRLIRHTSESRTSSRLSFAQLSIVTVLLLLVIGAIVIWRANVNSAVGSQIRSVAVLPCQNLSRDPEQDFFADGTTDTLISTLAQIHALDVTSRISIMRYKGTTKPLPAIAHELGGVYALVSCSVQRLGGRIRVTAQLVRASTDTHLWANTYERDVGDLLQLQAEITRAIAREIEVTVTPEEGARLARTRRVRPEAQEAYLRGRQHLFKSEEAALETAIDLFNEAIDLQPDYAEAYAGLATAWGFLRGRLYTQAEGEFRRAALKAVELDSDLAEAHVAMAGLHENEWAWAEADRSYRRALELNPDSLVSCTCYARFLAHIGRTSEALTVIEHAARVNPLSSIVHGQYGYVLHLAGRDDEAAPRYRRALELDPQDFLARAALSMAYDAMGKFEDAVTALDRPEFRTSPWLGLAYARAGRREEALRLVKGTSSLDALPFSLIYFALGDLDRGLEWLTMIFEESHPSVGFINASPDFDKNVRSDSRFQALVARLKIPDPVR